MRDSGYSRFPLCRGSLDNVIGMVYAKDLLSRYLSGQPIDLTARVRQPIYMPEGRSALEMLERFRTSRVHVALVLEEYGGVEGLITLRDLMEGIVGQILSAGEVSSPGAVQRSDGSWLVDGDYGDAWRVLGSASLEGQSWGMRRGGDDVACWMHSVRGTR